MKFFLSKWGLVTSSVVELRSKTLNGDLTETMFTGECLLSSEGRFADARDHPDISSRVTLPPQPNSANI